ncbi:MAG: FmdB family zinc ribbon protein [Planctomycetota bacterium]
MPTYEYECGACGHRFDQVQSMRDEPLRKCPACGKKALQRLVSGGTGFILKGAGFWRNDSKNRKSTAIAARDSKDAGETKPAGETKEAKSPQAPPDAKVTKVATDTKDASAPKPGSDAAKESTRDKNQTAPKKPAP